MLMPKAKIKLRPFPKADRILEIQNHFGIVIDSESWDVLYKLSGVDIYVLRAMLMGLYEAGFVAGRKNDRSRLSGRKLAGDSNDQEHDK